MPSITFNLIMTVDEVKNLIKHIYSNKFQLLLYDNMELKNFCNITYHDYSSIKELIYRIKHDIFEIPTCPICGNKLKFLTSKNRFQNHCSHRCATFDNVTQNKRKATCMELYGSESYTNRHKAEITYISKFGCTSPLGSKTIHEVANNTKFEKYGDSNYNNTEKRKQTCLERYGCESAAGNPDVRSKMKSTMSERYGSESFLGSDKMKAYRNTPDALTKISETKRKHNTFNTSKLEDYVCSILKLNFHNVMRQHKSKLYSYNCDFYIPEIDLYIECNFHWTHGGHPFNNGSEADIAKLNSWKSKNSRFYSNAIKTWTIRDVEKRNVAELNNLNYIEFFDIQEFNNWIKSNEGVSTTGDECNRVGLEISTSPERQTMGNHRRYSQFRW